jgi:hypothetical protein
VQDAVRAIDSLLTRATGGSAASGSAASDAAQHGAEQHGAEQHAVEQDGGGRAGSAGQAEGRPDTPRPSPEPGPPSAAAGQGESGPGDAAIRPDTLSGEHGPVGWKPGDRLATAGPGAVDPWATATEGDEEAESPSSGSSTPGGDPGRRGHGPGDRG